MKTENAFHEGLEDIIAAESSIDSYESVRAFLSRFPDPRSDGTDIGERPERPDHVFIGTLLDRPGRIVEVGGPQRIHHVQERADHQHHPHRQGAQSHDEDDEAHEALEEVPFDGQEGGADAKAQDSHDGQEQPSLDLHPWVQPFQESHRAHDHGGRSMTTLVLLAENPDEVRLILGGTQAVPEVLVFQETGDPCQRFEMGPGGVGRRHKEEEEVNRLSVQRIKGHAGA